MSTPKSFTDLKRPSHPRGICRVDGCDETTVGQIVLRLRESAKPHTSIASSTAGLCESHAVALFEQMSALLPNGNLA